MAAPNSLTQESRAQTSRRVDTRLPAFTAVPSHSLSLTHAPKGSRIEWMLDLLVYPSWIESSENLGDLQRTAAALNDVGVGCEATFLVPNNGRNERKSNVGSERERERRKKAHEYRTSQRRRSNWNAAVGRGPYITVA